MGCIPEEQFSVAVTREMRIAQGQTKELVQPQALVLQEVQVQLGIDRVNPWAERAPCRQKMLGSPPRGIPGW